MEAKWLKDVDFWLRTNLNNKLVEDGFNQNLVIDFSHIYLSAHSSGAHIAINYLNKVNGLKETIKNFQFL